jgi:hypothetical protein
MRKEIQRESHGELQVGWYILSESGLPTLTKKKGKKEEKAAEINRK